MLATSTGCMERFVKDQQQQALGQKPDINFNSPGHRSSQDGSFIQDDDDNMQLILEFGNVQQQHQQKRSGVVAGQHLDAMVTSPVVDLSKAKQLAAKFDANIAELDFDNFLTRDIVALNEGRYCTWDNTSFSNNNHYFNGDEPMMLASTGGIMPCSMDLSLNRSRSLFSSVAGDDSSSMDKSMEIAAVLATTNVGFVSTDSLNLGQACALAAHKGDYRLTLFEASKHDNSPDADVNPYDFAREYEDAPLSDGVDRSLEYKFTADSCSMDSNTASGISSQASFTTWGKIKRSYELERPQTDVYRSRFTSLPILMQVSAKWSQPFVMGAGEKMVSADGQTGVGIVPIFDVRDSALSSSLSTSFSEKRIYLDGDRKRFSLFHAFQSKLGANACEKLDVFDHLPASATSPALVSDSSGYATGGQGSSASAADAGKRKKQPPKKLELVAQHSEDNTAVPTPSAMEADKQRVLPPAAAAEQDWQYSEYFADGRYIDVNHNEVGFAPACTAPYQSVASSEASQQSIESPSAPLKPPRTFASEQDIRKASGQAVSVLPKSGSSTSINRLKDSGTQLPVYVVNQSVQTSTVGETGQFITVVTTAVRTLTQDKPVYVNRTIRLSPPTSPREKQEASRKMPGFGPLAGFKLPDLSFLKLPFSIPALFPSVPEFPAGFVDESHGASTLKAPLSTKTTPTTTFASLAAASSFEKPKNVPAFLLPDAPPRFYTSTTSASLQKFGHSPLPARDSGLGASGSAGQSESHIGGPAHIQDWDSLSMLLPRDVLQTYAFFRANAGLLTGSKAGFPSAGVGTDSRDVMTLSIDKPLTSPRVKMRPPSTFGHRQKRRSRPLSEPINEEDSSEDVRIASKLYCAGSERMNHCVEQHAHRCGSAPRPLYHSDCCVGQRTCCAPPPCCAQPIYVHHHCCCMPCGVPTTAERPHVYTWPKQQAKKQRMCCAEQHRPPSFEESSEDERQLVSGSESQSSDEAEYAMGRPLPHTRYSDFRLKDNEVERPHFWSVQNLGLAAGPSANRSPNRPTCLDCESGCNSGSPKACATCYRVRSPSVSIQLPSKVDNQEYFCDCETSDILEERELQTGQKGCPTVRKTVSFASHVVENVAKAAIKSPDYKEKKDLVRRLSKASDTLVALFGGSTHGKLTGRVVSAVHDSIIHSLCPAVWKVIADGLLAEKSVWTLIEASATIGPATISIHELVTDLKQMPGHSGESPDDRLVVRFQTFVIGLLNLHSLDCWLSYLALKDNILREHYEKSAFLLHASSAYRALFTEAMVAIQPLSLLPFDQLNLRPPARFSKLTLLRELKVTYTTPEMTTKAAGNAQTQSQYELIPTFPPSDSRIPKSSSVPARLSGLLTGWGSRRPKSKSLDSGISALLLQKQAETSSDMKKVVSQIEPQAMSIDSEHGIDDEQFFDESSDFETAGSGSMTDDISEKHSMNRFVCAIEDVQGDAKQGTLAVRKGENLLLVSIEGSWLRCQRDNEIGLVPRSKVTFVTFL